MHTLLQDLHYGLRMLRRSPGFTAVAVLTLALGIGANTAIFSVVNAVLLRPLPYTEPERLTVLWGNNIKEGVTRDPVAYPNFLDWQAQARSFEQMAAITPSWSLTLTGAGEAQRVTGFFVSPHLFPMLGVTSARGRTFAPEDGEAGKEHVAIVSHGLWQRIFGGDPDLPGKTLALDGTVFTVIGVMPPGFHFMEEADVWLPISPAQIAISRFVSSRPVRLFQVIGRLKPDVALGQAQAEMAAIAGRLEQQYPDTNTGLGVRLVGLHDDLTGDVRYALLILFGAVGFVLLIACANVANLILTRTAVRQKESAIRAALGAGRGRLVQQFLTESGMLALLGGVTGLLLAFWGVDALLALGPGTLPGHTGIGIDGRVLGFTFAVTLLTALLFGLAPALQASQCDRHDALKEGGRSSRSGAARLRGGLVVAEIAVTLVLLIGAGLLIRSFREVLRVDPGFRTDSLLTMTIPLSGSVYGDARQRVAVSQQLEERIAGLPGVTSVGLVTRLPLRAPDNNITTTLTVEGRPVAEGEKPEVDFRRASPGYFRAMGIPLVQGRGFTEKDVSLEAPTALINEAMARRFFPGENPVGKRIKLGANTGSDPWITIVGVVGSVRHLGLEVAPRPEVYRHLMTSPPFGSVWAIRTATDPMALMPAIRTQVDLIDPNLPIAGVATMNGLIDRSMADRRFSMFLLGVFGGVALLLAVVGLYGVMAYGVAQRTREIGIRMALGARPGDVLRLVVGQGMRLAAAGILIGIVAAFGLTRLMGTLLYGVTPTDPVTFAGIAAVLSLAALAANYLPARRAMRVDPVVALRHE